MKKKYKLRVEYPGSHPAGTISKLDYSRYPGVWEEITEEGYEIIHYTDGNNIYYKSINGNFTINTAHYYSEDWLINNNFRIQAVRRLSDGEVFTVGEEISFGDEDIHRIECFKEQSSNNFWAYYNSYLCYGANIEVLKKIDKPLFKTEDGVDIFSKYKSYYLVTKDFVIAYCSVHSEKDLEYNLFSTKEAADEYVKMNKPEFSRNQISEMLNKIGKGYEI